MTLGKRVLCMEFKLSYMQMQGMDTYHGSHGDSSGFESGAGLSIPWVLLSLPDGVPDEDTFLRHSFSLSPPIPRILYEGFVVLCSCSCAL